LGLEQAGLLAIMKILSGKGYITEVFSNGGKVILKKFVPGGAILAPSPGRKGRRIGHGVTG